MIHPPHPCLACCYPGWRCLTCYSAVWSVAAHYSAVLTGIMALSGLSVVLSGGVCVFKAGLTCRHPGCRCLDILWDVWPATALFAIGIFCSSLFWICCDAKCADTALSLTLSEPTVVLPDLPLYIVWCCFDSKPRQSRLSQLCPRFVPLHHNLFHFSILEFIFFINQAEQTMIPFANQTFR